MPLTLSTAATQQIDVNVTTPAGGAATHGTSYSSGVDFQFISFASARGNTATIVATVTIGSQQNGGALGVNVFHDGAVESAETVVLTLAADTSNPPKYTVGTRNVHTITIRDEPEACDSVAPTELYEGENPMFTVTYSRFPAINSGITFHFGGSAGGPQATVRDYYWPLATASAGKVVFPMESAVDDLVEGDEEIILDIQIQDASHGQTYLPPGPTCRARITLKDGAAPTAGIVTEIPGPSGIVLEKITNLVEGKEARPYTVELLLAPGSGETVTVTATSQDSSALGVGAGKVTSTAATHTLTFTETDWNVAQTVMVTAIEDADMDNEADVTITHSSTSSDTSSSYHNFSGGSVTVDVTDDDTSNHIGIMVNPTVLNITEGGSATYTVKLDKNPQEGLTVTVGHAAGNQGNIRFDTGYGRYLDPSIGLPKTYQYDLFFDETNWNVAQTVTVTAEADIDLRDHLGNRAVHAVDGGTYDGFQNSDLVINVREASRPTTPGVTTSQPFSAFDRIDNEFLVTVEDHPDFDEYPGYRTLDYYFRLDTQPTHDVVFSIPNTDPGAIEIDVDIDTSPTVESSVTITPATWDQPRYARIRAVPDADAETEEVVLTPRASSDDNSYDITLPSITVIVVDTDITVSPTALTLTEGGTTSYNLSLSTFPVSFHEDQTVTITVASSDSTAVRVDTNPGMAGYQNTVTFDNTLDFNSPRRVTVEAVSDMDSNNESVSITHTVTASDPTTMPYHNFPADPVAVSVTDQNVTTPVVTIAPGTAVAEGTAAGFTINANPAPSANLAVTVTVTDDANSDFVASGAEGSQTLTITAGSTGTAYSVATQGDGVDEPNGGVKVAVKASGDNGYTVGAAGVATTPVNDNDATSVTLSGPSGNVTEGGTKAITLALGRGLVSGEGLTVPLTFGSGTAMRGTDYTLACPNPLPTGVTCPNLGGNNPRVVFTGPSSGATASSVAITLAAVADSTVEGSGETVMIGLGSLAGTNLGGGTTPTDSLGDFSIMDAGTPAGTVAQFASGSSSAAENAGTRNVAINLNPAPGNAIALNYTVGGTASEGGSGDFTIANSGTVSVNANASSVNIPVALRDDTTDEPRETVVLTLTQGSGYTVGSTSAHTLAITDNDITTVTLSTPDTTAEEQNSGNTATLRLALNRGLEAGEALAVPLRFSGGTAGTHFRLACPTPRPTGVTCANLGNANAAVTFTGPGSGASATAVSLTLSVPNDDGDTSDRTVTASIPASTSGNPRLTATGLGGGASGSRSGNGQIVLADDDTARPTVTISAGSGVTEGTAAGFTVSTSTTLTVALSVRVRVDDVPGSDFVASGGQGVRTVTIPANQASANFSVSTEGDSTDEASGPVSASVVNHASYVVGSPGTASVTVTDNDATAATLAGPAGDVREGNAKVLTLTLNRGLRSGEVLTVPLSFAGAAVRNTDYTLSGAPATGVAYNNLNSGTASVVFTGPNAGASAAVARITLSANSDGAAENPEAVDIGLGSLTPSGLDGGANGVDSLASFNIEDPPPVRPTVRFSSAASRAPEDAGTRNVTINLSPAPNTPLTLRYAVGGNAAGGDFSIAGSGTLSVGSGDTAATIAVTITDDIEDENDETVVLTLTSDATYTIGSPGAHTLTIADDDTTPVAAFASGASSVGEGAGTVNVAVRLTPPPQEDVTVTYAVADGTATAGSDYTRPSGTTLSFATGVSTATIAIPIIDDNAAEGAETVALTLGGCTGCTLGSPARHTLTIRSSDNPPSASDGTAATRPGRAYAFRVEDFGYRDPDGDALAHVTVVTLPAQGTLALGGAPAAAGAQIPQARIASGDLTFTPEPGEKGEPYASFTFTVNDGSADSAASYTLALDVRNDPPEAADGEVQLRQGRPHTFRVEDFEAGYSDADGDRLAGIVIVAPPGKGMLALSGTVVATNDVSVTRGELEMGELTFTAAPGESGSPYTEFMFKVNDGFEDSLDSAKMTLHVQSVAAGRMIEQWLARFGRTVADQVIEAVEERLNNPSLPAPEASLQLRLAGRELESLRPLEGGQPTGEASGPDNPGTTPDASPLPDPRENLPAHAALEASVEDALRPQRETSSLSLSDLDWLGGTSFRYARGDPAGGLSSVWGRGAISRFDGRDGSARVDGRVESLMLGADFVQDGRALGVLLSHSRGEGDYRGESGGRFDSDLTGIYPYARHEINDQLSVWGVAGYGEGELELRREASTEETDLELWMVAGGLRGQLCPGGWGWPELSAVADVLWVETESDALGEVLPAADAQVSRVRIGMEGAWRALPLGDGQLSPRLRLSLRHDGGDAEHGFGTEVRAGLGWTDARRGLSAQLQAHALLTHEEDGAQEKGVSGSLAWDPRPGSLRGAEFSLTARTGDPLDQAGLLAHDSFERAAPRETRQAWQATLGYGVGAFGDRVTAVPQARLGWSGDARDLGLGWRLVADGFDLRLEAVRRDSESGGSDSRVQVRLQGRW